MRSSLELKHIKRPPCFHANGKVKDPADAPLLRQYQGVVRRMRQGMTEEEAIADYAKMGTCRYKQKDGTVCGKAVEPLHRICRECKLAQSAEIAQRYRDIPREKECPDCGCKFTGKLRTKICPDCRYGPKYTAKGGRPLGPKKAKPPKPKKPKKTTGMTVAQREKEWASRLPANWLKPGAKPEDGPKPAPVVVPKGFKVTYGPPAPGRWDNPEA